MPDATKNIKFKTSIDGSEDVKNQFSDINNSIEDTANVADTKLKPAMVDAKQYTMRVGEATEETTSMFAGLAGSLIGGAGVVAAMLAARAIMEQFTKTELEAAEEGDKFRQTLINIQSAAEVVNLSIGKATQSLREMTDEMLTLKVLQLDEDIREIETGFSGLWKMFIMSAEAERDILLQTKNQIIEIQKLREAGISGEGPMGQINWLKEQVKLNIELRDLSYGEERVKYDEIAKELQGQLNDLLGIEGKIIKDNIKAAKEHFGELKGTLIEYLNIIRAIEKGAAGTTTLPLATPGMVNVPRKPKNQAMEDFWKEQAKDAEQEMQQFSQASAYIFAQNMNEAWESIFGEANSMFEQMISAWGSMLFEKVGFGIFNMLFGGIDILGFARGIFAGNSTAAKYGMGK